MGRNQLTGSQKQFKFQIKSNFSPSGTVLFSCYFVHHQCLKKNYFTVPFLND